MGYSSGVMAQGELQNALKSYMMPIGDSEVAYFSGRGGRLVGVFRNREGDTPNSLWTPPDLAKAFEDGRWNLGGDRLWVGPEFGSTGCGEATYFCRKPGDYGTWICQKDMDPGNWEMTPDGSNVRFTNEGRITNFKAASSSHQLHMQRAFKPGTPPEGHNDGIQSASLHFKDDVKVEGTSAFQAWKLVQLASGIDEQPGTVIFPTTDEPVMAVYMNKGLQLPEYLRMGEGHVSIRTQGMRDTLYKLAPETSALRRVGGSAVVMQISKSPAGGDDYQLMVMRSPTVPTIDQHVLEVSSFRPPAGELPTHLRGERGPVFVYNGPSPTDPTNFTEAEMLGTKPGPYNGFWSSIIGDLTFFWGEPEQILDAAKAAGGLRERPLVFGLNE